MEKDWRTEDRMKRGPFFWLNLAALWTLLYLFTIQSIAVLGSRLPFHRPWIYAVCGLMILLAHAAFFRWLKDREVNRRVFLSLLFVWGSCEVFVRILQRNQPFTEDVYRKPKPYVEFVGTPNGEFTIDYATMGEPGQGKDTYKINSMGFRFEGELSKNKPKTEYRVFVLGGSTVFNGYPLSHSIPGLIEDLFKQDGFSNVKVYNFGVVGFVSGQELALLTHTLVDYHPDLVIVYDGGNDVYQPLQYDPRPGYPCNFISYEAGNQHLSRNAPIMQLFDSLLFKSSFFRLVFSRGLHNALVSLESVRQECGYGSPEWEAQVASAYINNHGKMARLGEAFGFRLFSFLQPMIYFNPEYRSHPVRGKSPAALYVTRVYDQIRPQLTQLDQSQVGRPKRAFFTDFSDLLKSHPASVFWDIIHIRYEGNRYIAENIYRTVRKNLPKETFQRS
jgi:lysophospholipase L1-like esterase